MELQQTLNDLPQIHRTEIYLSIAKRVGNDCLPTNRIAKYVVFSASSQNALEKIIFGDFSWLNRTSKKFIDPWDGYDNSSPSFWHICHQLAWSRAFYRRVSGKQRIRERGRERCRHDNWQRKSKRERPLEVGATVSPLRHAPALTCLNDADGRMAGSDVPSWSHEYL